ncbi:uncharacterized protein LOC127449157 isoform X2 [Myxocyprinus asiaticus]|uniref:uncharacterized protein LOC127449157 isoform X2 n=1 Tax=Myxocyprinus asiaticus TaxID=70543 RepID=UPI00222298FA|nr:uncharacterized protein LOC127449157 isoform X2 [Myxocyprinus asiaticus]
MDSTAMNKMIEQTMTRKEMDTKNEGEERCKDKVQQTENDKRKRNHNEKGHGTSKGIGSERQESVKNCGEVSGEQRVKYCKELTVEVEVEGTENVSMMELLKGVKEQCGEVMGCRVRSERIYELTMKDNEAKSKLMDGVRIKGAMVHARDIINNEMVVSFINLPVYLEDEKIFTKLEEWGVKPISAIKRRIWPGTETADGTRFLKVRFTEQVRSLPYSTKFETLRGTEYFRVIHDRQVRVCRLCIKPGHIFRECPEFKCFKCGKEGHYARECDDRRGEERVEESGQEDDGERTENKRTEEQDEEVGDDVEREMKGEGEAGEGGDKMEWRYRSESTSEDGDDEEEMEQKGESEEGEEGCEKERDGVVEKKETVQEPRSRSGGVRREEERGVGLRSVKMTTKRLSAKRKAKKDRERAEQIKEQRSGSRRDSV